MAYEFKAAKDDQEDDETSPLGPGFVPPISGGGPGAPGGGGGGAPQAPASKFVNFDRILNANKDVAARNAGQLTGTLQTNAQAGRSALTGVVGNFNAGVAAGTPKNPNQPNGTPSPGPMPASGRAPDSGPIPSGNTSTRGSIVPDPFPTRPSQQPLGGAVTPEQAQANLDAAVYTGPTDITKDPGFAEMWQKIGKSDDELALLGQEGGLGALSQRYLAGGGPYTQGMQSMDAALLGATGRPGFDRLQKEYGDSRKLVDRAVGDAEKMVGDAQGGAKSVHDYWQGVIDKNKAEQSAPKPKQVWSAEQVAADHETNKWMDKIRDTVLNDAGFLGLDAGKANRARTAWQKGQAGDWSEWMKLLDERFGPGTGGEWMNAFKDTAGRNERISSREGANDGSRPQEDLGLVNGAVAGLQPYLISEQEKRNNGNWSPDWMI